MNIIAIVILFLILLAISYYFALILITIGKYDEFGESIPFKMAIQLPGLMIFRFIYIYFKEKSKRDGKTKGLIEVGVLQYPVALVILLGIIQDHKAQINLYGESSYFIDKQIRNDTKKSWTSSLSNIKKFLYSEKYLDELSVVL